MKLTGPKRIMLEMMLMEQEIAIDDDGTLSIKMDNEDYYLDPDSKKWVSFSGMVVGSAESQKLTDIAATDEQAKLRMNAVWLGQPYGGHGINRTRRRGGIQQVRGDGEEFDEQWYIDYRAKLDEWGDAGKLTGLPEPIAARFSGYWQQLDTGKDFVAVLPTNYIMKGSKDSSGGFKGLYVFRKNAQQSSRYIREGEDWTSYFPKLNPHNRGLLDIRKNAIALDLGRFLRRDHHTKNITMALEGFESFDAFTKRTDMKVESVEIMTRARYRKSQLQG